MAKKSENGMIQEYGILWHGQEWKPGDTQVGGEWILVICVGADGGQDPG